MSYKFKNLCGKAVALLLLFVLLPMQVSAAASGTHTPVDGVTVEVSGASDNSMSSGAVTVTAKGSGGLFGLGAEAKTATITITNGKAKSARLSFDWTATSVNQLVIDGTTTGSDSGSFSKQMDAGTSITITITTAKNSTTNKLVMQNFSIVEVADSSNVTVQFNSGYSVSVDGTETSNGDVVNVTAAGVTLKANTSNFVAWVNTADHTVLSKTAEYLLKPTGDMTVKAINSTNACFEVGNKIFETLTEATTEATNGATKTIVLLNNGTLPAGDYTIPSGVTLLIPFDSANTMYTTTPKTVTFNVEEGTYFTPVSVYRTLSMAEDAKLTINGAMSISGKQCATQDAGYNGAPSGPQGFVKMASGSSITVNNGGNLYAWGFITGSGSVTAKSGATVYEAFQIRDWRGGNATSGMLGNSQDVFPLSQYYIQNIEVPLTLEAGAKENVCSSVDITLAGIQQPVVTLIGQSDGMFRLTSGSLTKDYDETNDRLSFTIDGDISISNLVISLKLSVIGTKTIDSKDYVLPLNSNYTVNVNTGSLTVSQNFAMLPGAELNIAQGAKCVLGSGINLYVYDDAQWGGYTGVTNNTFKPVVYSSSCTKDAPIRKSLSDAVIHIEGTMDASAGSLYTTTGGAAITGANNGKISVKPGTATITYQAAQNGNEIASYPEISITSAQLTNGGGDKHTAGADTYTNVDGVWTCTNHIGAEATCTTAKVCTFCMETVENAKGHNYGNTEYTWSEDNKICTATGTCTVETCTNDIEGHTETVEATTITSAEKIPATCTVMGTTTYTATFAEEVTWAKAQIKDVQDIPTTEHTPGEPKTENSVEVTCTANGSYDTVIYCSAEGCGAEISRQTTTVQSSGHTSGDIVVENKVEATCGKAGSYDNVTYCTVCEEETSRETVTVDATGHTYGEAAYSWAADYSSCTVTLTCSVCEEGIEGHALSATDSRPESSTVSGNCQTKAETTYTASVELNGTTYSKTETVTGEKDTSVHVKIVDVAGTPATCTKSGLSAGKKCESCGVFTEPQTPISALGHNYESVVTAPTCTAGGYTTHTCTACGDSYVTDEVETVGHSYKEEITTAATCEADGVKTLTCTTCGDSYTEAITKLGHDMQKTAAEVAPTCEMPGKTAVLTCANNCGKTEGGEEIPATGHKDENKDHACDNGCDAYQGTHADSNADSDHVCDYGCGAVLEECSDVTADKDHKCDVCGKENVTMHEYTSEVTAPTCTTGGYTTHTCNCGYSYTDSEVAAGHTIEQVAAQAKTCTQEGWNAYEYCTKCDYTTKAVIPAGHTLTQVEAKAATCTEIGWEAYEKCSQCDYTTYKEIPATGEHTYDNACDAECNVCSAIRTPADHVYDNACDTNCNVCGAERSITHAWKDATCTAPKTCSVCGATEGEATGHVNTTSSTVQNDDGSTHTTTVTCACGEVVSIETEPCTDQGGGTCECGRVLNAQVNVDNKTKTEDIWTVTGTTMNVKHDLACVVLVEENDGTYTRLTATANANGGYDFDVSGVKSGETVVIAVKGDLDSNGKINSTDAMQMQQAEVGLLTMDKLQHIVCDVDDNGRINSTDAMLTQQVEVGLMSFAWEELQ